jgi:hypothetical protein
MMVSPEKIAIVLIYGPATEKSHSSENTHQTLLKTNPHFRSPYENSIPQKQPHPPYRSVRAVGQ